MNSQMGNLPYTSPTDYYNFYNQVNMNYRYKILRLYSRFEVFGGRDSGKNYGNFNQYRLEIKYKRWQFKAGHFYDMFGRGLLLRAYEIPETIYEDAGYRVRHGFYRDIFGANLAYNSNNYRIKAFYGKPLINLLPPTLKNEQRRKDVLAGFTGSIDAAGVTLSTSYINNSGVKKEQFISFGLNSNISSNMDVYFEYAHESDNYFTIKEENRYGIYGNLNYYSGALGLSLEYKYYNLFLLGSGYNDPPNLVKEHTYPVLNRRTHVNILENESGFQFESYYRLNADNLLTANISLGKNELSRVYRYYEFFLQTESSLSGENVLKLFLDYSADEAQGEKRRISLGGIWERPLVREWHFKVDLESQRFDRDISGQAGIFNHYLALAVMPDPKITASLIWEITNDRFLTDDPRTDFVETSLRNWYGFNFSYRPGAKNRFEIFAGQRRGGPSCTSGICFDVLDFAGVEVKWITRI